VLAFLYRRTGSIIAPVVAHLLNNSLAFASLYAMLQA
jgi:membrane protease YdiL (CAAX protease family)